MLYKPDWDNAKERYKAWWEREVIDRCSAAILVLKAEQIPYKQRDIPLDNQENLKLCWTDPDWIYERNIAEFNNTHYMGESFPYMNPQLGAAGHAAYFGCKYSFTPETVWFYPIINDLSKDVLKFDPQNEMLTTQRMLLKNLSKRCKDKCLVTMPDNCGILDALVSLRGANNLLADIYEEPDKIKESLKLITKVWKQTQSEFFEIIKDNNDGGCSHNWMQLWAPFKFVHIQCDFSVMISPKHYEEFVLPELEETSDFVGNTIYHLDGFEQIRHLDMILSVKNIKAIQWTPVSGQPPTSAFIDVFKKIQKAGKGLILFPDANEVELLLSELSSNGLHLIINDLKSQQEADEMFKNIAKWTRT